MATIKLKRSTVAGTVPTTANLVVGEVAVNTEDGYLYAEKSDGTTVQRIGTTSDRVSFTPAGTGAVTTTMQEKLRQYVSIKDYGGVPGAGDNATAFERALAVSSMVEVPAGTWRTSKYVDEHKLFGPGTVVCYNTGWDRTLSNKALIQWDRLVTGIPRTLAKLKAKQPTRIVFTGDSVTWGLDNGLTTAQTYCGVFSTLMAAAYPDAKVKRYDRTAISNYAAADVSPTVVQNGSWEIDIVKNGIGGNNVPRIMARSFGIFGNDNGSGVDCVCIMVGINDALTDVSANQKAQTVSDYERSLDALVREIRRFRNDVDIVLLTPTWNELSADQRLDTYSDAMKRVASLNRIPVVDTRKLFLDHYAAGVGINGQSNWFVTSADSAHPSATGHAAIAQRIYDDLFSAKSPSVVTNSSAEKPLFVPITQSGFFTYSGTWISRAANSSGFEGTDFQQIYCTTAESYVEFTTSASEVYMLAMTTPAGSSPLGATSVEIYVNGFLQRSHNLQTSTASDSANTNFTTSPRQRYLVYKNGMPGLGQNLYTIRIKNASGGFLIFDGVEIYNDKKLREFTQGEVGVLTDTISGNYSTKIVVFPEPFRSIPSISVTSNSIEHIAVIDKTSITKTQAKIYCAKLNGTAAPVGCDFSYTATALMNKSI